MPTRIKAFLIHIAVSIFVALCVLLLVFKLWYPGELSDALGVSHIFLIIIAVDVVLGPLMTLMIFNVAKPPSRWQIKGFRWNLKCDVVVIIFFQLLALAYGIHTVAQSRPLWLVLMGNQFNVVRSVDLEDKYVEKAASPYNRRSFLEPQWVGASQPGNPEKQRDIMLDAFAGEADVHQRPEYYQSLESMGKGIWERSAQPFDNLAKFNTQEEINRVLGHHPDANGWLPLIATQKDKVVLINKEKTWPLAIVDLKPW